MRWVSLIVLAACLMACEGGEIAIFAVNQGGSAGVSGTPAASGRSGAPPAGAAGPTAGADPGGTGGTGGGETGGGEMGGGELGGDGALEPPCFSIADCDDGYYCSKQRCEDVQGACLLRPIPDDDTSDMPVCGCDHTVYSNDTLRQAYGIAASTPGPCNSSPHPCSRDEECGGGLCARYLPPMSVCGPPPGPAGRCWITPVECPAVDTPQYQVCSKPDSSGGAMPCVSRCQAIKSKRPFMQLPQDQSCP